MVEMISQLFTVPFNDFPSWEVTDYVFYHFYGFGLRSDADRFPFLPESLPRVAKKVWNRCCVTGWTALCVRLSQSRTNRDNDACRLGKWQVSSWV
jgi:hypothetical protein